MTRVIYYTATTLDGFIADPHDSLDWLLRQPQDGNGSNDYETFFAGIGALVMGSTTYEWVLRHDPGSWVYEVPTWVMTHRELPLPAVGTGAAPGIDSAGTDGVSTDSAGTDGAGSTPDVRFSSAPIARVYADMRDAAGGRDLWVVGGGDLAGQFADAGLLDEIMTSIAPVTLGAGRRLLPRRLDLELLEVGRNGAFVTARHRVVGPLREDGDSRGR